MNRAKLIFRVRLGNLKYDDCCKKSGRIKMSVTLYYSSVSSNLEVSLLYMLCSSSMITLARVSYVSPCWSPAIISCLWKKIFYSMNSLKRRLVWAHQNLSTACVLPVMCANVMSFCLLRVVLLSLFANSLYGNLPASALLLLPFKIRVVLHAFLELCWTTPWLLLLWDARFYCTVRDAYYKATF